MRDRLPKTIRKYERGIINLDSMEGLGTHWTAYKKLKGKVVYFDSFGNLRPPTEVLRYFTSKEPCKIMYNYNMYQKFNTDICGHLCLKFLTQ